MILRLAALLGLALSGCQGSTGGSSLPPLACEAGSWPSAGTTGVPAGTPALTVLGSDLHTSVDGQVFDAVELRGRLYVDHAGVTIRRSRLIGDEYYAVYATAGGHGLTIEDSEILGGVRIPDGFTGRRNHLHAPAGGTRDDGWFVSASHVLLEDNLIDGLVGGDGAHLDGIQVAGGQDITVRHNRVEAVSPPISGGGVNAAIFFAADLGAISDVTVDCNLLIEQDGYYPLRIYDARGAVVVRRNRWVRGFLGAPVHVEDTGLAAWEDNAYEDGEAIPAP
ncbi:MAG: right-handed parallel beta-helix repeat-containing protein [Anaeromyxobacter sp.]